MSAQVTISQLPTAGAITGTELVPVVQNGVTAQTTTGAIAGSPTQTYTYLTVTQTPQLANSRYVGVTNGLVITDGGAQGLFNIGTTGALLSLVNAGTGFQVKTNATTLTPRSITATGTGLSISNGSGVSGDPTISLTGQVLNFANASFNGLVVLSTAGAITSATITGTSSQIVVTNGNGISGNPTVSLADNPVLPGTGSVTVPVGTTGQQPSGNVGMIRYDSSVGAFLGYSSSGWNQFSLAGSTFSAGSTGFTPNTPTAGAVTLAGILNVANGGTGLSTTPANGALDIGNGTGFTRATLTAGSNFTITNSAGGISIASSNPGGTVTSVSFTGGIISVATATTTPALTVAGTSGGIPYFSSASTWASSAALTQYGVVYGGGAGATPVATAAGTTGQVLTATTGGAPTWAAPATSGTVTSVAQSFTGGLISVAGSPITSSGTLALTVAGTSGGIPYFTSGTTWATSAALAASALMVGGGAGAAPSTITTGTGVVTALGVNTGSAGAFVLFDGALGTPSSGTVTNLTGTASININGTVGATTPTTGSFTNITGSANAIISVTDNTNAALRITQLGTGNALLVEDSTNPDSTPFLIDANGAVVQGYTAAVNNWNGAPDSIQSHTTASNARPSVGLFNWSSNTGRSGSFNLYKSTSNVIGTQGAVANLQQIGRIVFSGDDGTTFIPAAQIDAFVDGTPGTNDMPGGLRFFTTADGASTPTVRMQISSAGNVGIGTTSPATKLDVSGTINATQYTGISGGTF